MCSLQGALALNDEEEVRRQRAAALAKDREARMMEAYQVGAWGLP